MSVSENINNKILEEIIRDIKGEKWQLDDNEHACVYVCTYIGTYIYHTMLKMLHILLFIFSYNF